jgi:two-component system sensor histidine kinase MtrB
VHATGWRVERIVANLVLNAVRHGQRPVEVSIGHDHDGPYLAVADAGPGIAADDIERVFDRFYMADRSRSGTGSGLGLAIAAEHAKRLGATIDVVSAPGRGSCFTVHFPGSASASFQRPPSR